MGKKLVIEHDIFSLLVESVQKETSKCILTQDSTIGSSNFDAVKASKKSFERRELLLNSFSASLSDANNIVLSKAGTLQTKDNNLANIRIN